MEVVPRYKRNIVFLFTTHYVNVYGAINPENEEIFINA
jgi:hypothetical protein